MSSLDGIGRYFPLTLFAVADDDAAIPPPELDAQDAWFAAAEQLLMATLDHNLGFDAVTAALGDMAMPFARFPEPPSRNIVGVGDGAGAVPGPDDFATRFQSLREVEHAKVYAAATFWWTAGGEGFAPVALCERHMPDPLLYAAMLTGDFAEHRA